MFQILTSSRNLLTVDSTKKSIIYQSTESGYMYPLVVQINMLNPNWKTTMTGQHLGLAVCATFGANQLTIFAMMQLLISTSKSVNLNTVD